MRCLPSRWTPSLACPTDIGRSPTTVKAYCRDLKDYWKFPFRGLDWRGARLEDIREFVAWLQLPPAGRCAAVAVLSAASSHVDSSRVNRKLAAVSAFYARQARNGAGVGDLPAVGKTGGRGWWKPFLHHVSKGNERQQEPDHVRFLSGSDLQWQTAGRSVTSTAATTATRICRPEAHPPAAYEEVVAAARLGQARLAALNMEPSVTLQRPPADRAARAAQTSAYRARKPGARPVAPRPSGSSNPVSAPATTVSICWRCTGSMVEEEASRLVTRNGRHMTEIRDASVSWFPGELRDADGWPSRRCPPTGLAVASTVWQNPRMPPDRAAVTQAVVTDLDGTIVRPDETVSPATIDAIAGLRPAGVALIVATARSLAGLTVLGPLLAEVSVAVCCNGAIGLVPSTGEVLWQHWLDESAVVELADYLTTTWPEAGLGSYDGGSWLLSPGYYAARGRRPRGPQYVVPVAELRQRRASTLASAFRVGWSLSRVADAKSASGLGG